MTGDLSFRVVCARTTDTVRGAAASQGATGKTAGILGELITGAVLIRHAMARNLRVQVILQGSDGRSAIVADAHPDGMTRGLVKLAKGTSEIDLGPGALLQVMRTQPSGTVQQGVVDVPQEGGVSAALMAYMQESEQVVTMIAVTSLVPFADVTAFQQEMAAAEADWQLIVYGRALHSFTNPNVRGMGDPRMDHDPSADRQSWAAALLFLGEALD